MQQKSIYKKEQQFVSTKWMASIQHSQHTDYFINYSLLCNKKNSFCLRITLMTKADQLKAFCF